MFMAVTKLKRVKKALVEWIRQKPELNLQVESIRADLHYIQQNLMLDPVNEQLAASEHELHEKLDHLLNLLLGKSPDASG
ncbi:hypothetical protein AAC387_Pa07g2031 [Persea americana]